MNEFCRYSFAAFSVAFLSAGTLFAQTPPAGQTPTVTAPAPATPPEETITGKFGAPEPAPAQTAAGASQDPAAPLAPEDELVYMNATDVDIKDMIKQISKATGTNFLLDDKIRGKITIISEKPMTKDMAYQAFLSALQVMGFTTVKTPGGLLKIVATKDAISEPIDIFKNSSPETDQFITRIVQVKNISANDISSVIKSLVSKDGNLFAYPATNSLIFTDTGSNIDRILKIIKELDQEGPQEVIEIIPILNADASDVTEKILQLFEEDVTDGGAGGGAARNARRARRGAAANAPGELEDTPSISKVISDERTNSVIVLGSKRSILRVKALIARLDSQVDGVEGTIHVYYMKHANAKEMAEVLGGFVSDSSSGSDSTTRRGAASRNAPNQAGGTNAAAAVAGASSASLLEGKVKVTADEGTNSLVITASPKDYTTLVESVLKKLDIPRRQVYLEAVVMELSVEKSRTLGLSGNFGKTVDLGGNPITLFGALPPAFSTSITSIASAAGGLAGGGFSDQTISFGSGENAVSIPAVSAILQAIQTDKDTNILSTPSILTLDNEEAKIQVGREVPVPAQSAVSAGGVATNTFTREDTGVILTITPQISESDSVRLKIEQEVSDIESIDTTSGPTLSKKTVQTVVVANDKQTVVIGGLISDRASVTTNKTPLVGDIPVLGNLFKNRLNQKLKSNLLVFITPYIIRQRSDFLGILEKKIEERNMFIDLNYGVGQRKQIRQAIKNHTNELLEYIPAKSRTRKSESPPVVSKVEKPASDEVLPPPTPAKDSKPAPSAKP